MKNHCIEKTQSASRNTYQSHPQHTHTHTQTNKTQENPVSPATNTLTQTKHKKTQSASRNTYSFQPEHIHAKHK